MTEGPMENKLDGPGGSGVENKEEAEVGGRKEGPGLWTCFHCGAANWIDPSWRWVKCWQCSKDMYVEL
jgi:hypothetical protein